MDAIQVIELIEFKDFKHKIAITKKYDKTSKVEILDDKYVFIRRKDEEYARKAN